MDDGHGRQPPRAHGDRGDQGGCAERRAEGLDRAIQVHGGGGVTEDFGLASAYAHLRTLRLADGPDEVHKLSIARRELAPYIPRDEPAKVTA